MHLAFKLASLQLNAGGPPHQHAASTRQFANVLSNSFDKYRPHRSDEVNSTIQWFLDISNFRLLINKRRNGQSFQPMFQPMMQTFKKMIGEGSIGRVHLGKWQETDVAIKVLGSLNAVGLAMPGQPAPPALHASVVPAEPASSGDSNESGANSYAAEQSLSLRTLEREVSLAAPLYS